MIGSLVFLPVTAGIFFFYRNCCIIKANSVDPYQTCVSFTICLVSTLDLLCLSNSFIWVLGIIGLTDCEMYCLSALMVNASANNLSVISGRFINFWVEPVLSRTYKVYS